MKCSQTGHIHLFEMNFWTRVTGSIPPDTAEALSTGSPFVDECSILPKKRTVSFGRSEPC